MFERSHVKVKVEPRSTSRLSSTLYILPLSYIYTSKMRVQARDCTIKLPHSCFKNVQIMKLHLFKLCPCSWLSYSSLHSLHWKAHTCNMLWKVNWEYKTIQKQIQIQSILNLIQRGWIFSSDVSGKYNRLKPIGNSTADSFETICYENTQNKGHPRWKKSTVTPSFYCPMYGSQLC